MCGLCVCKPQTGSHKPACILIHQLQEVVLLVAASDPASFPFLHRLQRSREIDPSSMFCPLWFSRIRISLIKKGQHLTGAPVSEGLSEQVLNIWSSQVVPLKHCDFASSRSMPKSYAERRDSFFFQFHHLRWQGLLCGSSPWRSLSSSLRLGVPHMVGVCVLGLNRALWLETEQHCNAYKKTFIHTKTLHQTT